METPTVQRTDHAHAQAQGQAEAQAQAQAGLERLRSHLDRIDESLLDLIADRLETCVRIAEYKKANDVPMMQPHRIRHAHDRAERFAAERGVSAQFLHALYDAIIAEACRVETVAMDGVIG